VTATTTAGIRWPDLPPRHQNGELDNLADALRSNVLWYLRADGWASKLVARARQCFGAQHIVTTNSGTTAIQTALAAVGVGPGDEVVVSPITDMGSVIGILALNAVPVFADVDPHHYNVTAASIEAVLTPRTRAVEVVHLAGSPADMDPILDLCRRRGVTVVEDAAQSLGARYRGRHVGTLGHAGCLSFNQTKHLSCGDGGLVLTDDRDLYVRAHNLADKYYDRLGQGVRLQELGMNFRMSELQAAVAYAQLNRIDALVQRRHALGERLTAGLAALPGILPHGVVPGGYCSYWFYMLRVEEAAFGLSRDDLVRRLVEHGIPAGGAYLPRPLYREPLFVHKRFFPGGIWPAELIHGQRYDYTAVHCPQAERVLQTGIRVPIHEGCQDEHVDHLLHVLRQLAAGR
jgi:dTDP-4-amino-4,6-dideoxygalactose transaminase